MDGVTPASEPRQAGGHHGDRDVAMALDVLLQSLEDIRVQASQNILPFPPQSLLVQACFHGDPDEVRALLYKKEEVNYQVSLTYWILDKMFAIFKTQFSVALYNTFPPPVMFSMKFQACVPKQLIDIKSFVHVIAWCC